MNQLLTKWEADILTVKEAAELKGLSPDNLRQHLARPAGPPYFTFKGHVYLFRQDVIDWTYTPSKRLGK